MSRNYNITEPYPSVSATHMVGYGRGGAGNMVRVDPSNITIGAAAISPASAGKLRARQPDAYSSTGRGGAGNIHRQTKHANFSFDEELAYQQKMIGHPILYYHVGRGGAGNLINAQTQGRRSSGGSTAANAKSMSQCCAKIVAVARKSKVLRKCFGSWTS